MKGPRKIFVLAIIGLSCSLALCSEKKEELSGLYIIRPPHTIGLEPREVITLKNMITEYETQREILVAELTAKKNNKWNLFWGGSSSMSSIIGTKISALNRKITALEKEKQLLSSQWRENFDKHHNRLYAKWERERKFYETYKFLNPAIVALNTLNDALCIQATQVQRIAPKDIKRQCSLLKHKLNRKSALPSLASSAVQEIYKIRGHKLLPDSIAFFRAQWWHQNTNYRGKLLPGSDIKVSETQVEKLARAFNHYEDSFYVSECTEQKDHFMKDARKHYIECSLGLLLGIPKIDPCKGTIDTRSYLDGTYKKICRVCGDEPPEYLVEDI